MPRKQEYQLVTAKKAVDLEKKVKALLADGWTLSGELVYSDADGFVREMTKSTRPGRRPQDG